MGLRCNDWGGRANKIHCPVMISIIVMEAIDWTNRQRNMSFPYDVIGIKDRELLNNAKIRASVLFRWKYLKNDLTTTSIG